MNRLLITLFTLMLITSLSAQNVVNKDNSWMDFINEIAESSGNEQNINTLYEELSQIRETPFNINQITREQLERLPFLTDEQIENIQAYLYVNGTMKSIYELKLVHDLDLRTIRLLLPFVYLGEPQAKENQIEWGKLLRRTKNTAYFRFDSNLDTKAGYQTPADSTANRYLGSPFYSFVKYDFNAGDKMQFGFVAEKDAGERLRDGFLSFHFLLKDVGIFKRLAIGRYKLSFGQGLLMNTNFAMSKNILASNVAARAEGIARHYSTDEINYLQGVAASFEYRKNLITLFASAKNAAASVNDSVLTSLKTDAYYNTENDLSQRNGVMMYLAGVNWQRRFGALKMGATVIRYQFDKPYLPSAQPYNTFEFRGKQNWNAGVDYQYRWKRLFLFGETAMSSNRAMASLNGLVVNMSSTFKTTLVQRSYSKSYQAFYGAAFSEGSRVENEQGIYWGVQWNPFRYWRFSGYTDVFRFPWLKYGVDAPSEGFDATAQVDYFPKENFKIYLRYKYKEKEKNRSGEEAVVASLCSYNLQRARMQCDYALGEQYLFRSAIDYNYYREESKTATNGFAISESISKSFEQLPLEIDAQLTVFDTDSYDNAIYSSEKNVLYAFSFPSFSGKGVRYALNLQYDLGKKTSVWLKFAQTSYSDRSVIGSGLEQINGNSKHDLYILLRRKF